MPVATVASLPCSTHREHTRYDLPDHSGCSSSGNSTRTSMGSTVGIDPHGTYEQLYTTRARHCTYSMISPPGMVVEISVPAVSRVEHVRVHRNRVMQPEGYITVMASTNHPYGGWRCHDTTVGRVGSSADVIHARRHVPLSSEHPHLPRWMTRWQTP